MKPEIIPVIHAIDIMQVFTNVATCIRCGIKKVFLINHEVSSDELLTYAWCVKSKYPEMWVGVNILGAPIKKLLEMRDEYDGVQGLDGLWCDGTATAEDVEKRIYDGTFFGGLMFKYQPNPKDAEQAYQDAKSYTDVATTSGPATGKSPTTFKIKTIRENIGNHPLAIASGMTPENIALFDDVQYFLVASSITDASEVISEDKLKQLIKALDEKHGN